MIFMNNYYENLNKRIESENENVVLTVESTITNEQIEALQKLYPNAKIIKGGLNMKCLMEDCPYCYYDRLDEMYKCRETWEEVDSSIDCDFIEED